MRAVLAVGICLLIVDSSRAEPMLDPAGIKGTIVLCGGGALTDPVRAPFVELAGGSKARIVVIPTASEKADKDAADSFLEPWKELKAESVELLHTQTRKTADDEKFVAPLRKATAVWFTAGDQGKLVAAYRGTLVEKELIALLNRGGVITGGAALSKTMVTGGPGFDLLPGAIIGESEQQKQLLGVLAQKPGHFGIALDDKAILFVHKRRIYVGEGTVSLCLASGGGKQIRVEELKPKGESDLTMLRRAAMLRTQAEFPAKNAAVPEVPKGALVIVGGGGAPPEIVKKFIELAGGPDSSIVVLPTAMPDPLAAKIGEVTMLERAGAKNVKQLSARTHKDVESEESLDLLKKAKGLWFSGGRQWRFIDSYEGTKAAPLFFDVLKRGGVIGGSSAGASIQSEFMPRGSPIVNTEMACEGYTRGLGFLPGAAVDQHFTQRNRFADMTALMKSYPQILGIGIDESTAIVVQGTTAEVMGKNNVQFYDYRKPPEKGKADYVIVKPGERYDMRDRKVVQKPD